MTATPYMDRVDTDDDEAPADGEQQLRQPLMPPPTYDEAVTSPEAEREHNKAGVKKYPAIDRKDAMTVIPYHQESHYM